MNRYDHHFTIPRKLEDEIVAWFYQNQFSFYICHPTDEPLSKSEHFADALWLFRNHHVLVPHGSYVVRIDDTRIATMFKLRWGGNID